MVRALKESDFILVRDFGLGLQKDNEIGAVEPGTIKEFIIDGDGKTQPALDCVFISCTTFRAMEIAEEVENVLGIPVVTSNRSVVQFLHRWVDNSNSKSR